MGSVKDSCTGSVLIFLVSFECLISSINDIENNMISIIKVIEIFMDLKWLNFFDFLAITGRWQLTVKNFLN